MWSELVVSVLAAIGVVAIPGALVVLAVGLRGRWLVGLAIPAGMTVVTLASLLGGFLGMSWSVLPVALVAVGLIVVVAAIRFLLWRKSGLFLQDDRPQSSLYYGLIAAAAAVIAVQFVVIIGAPDNISQTFDNIFHLNAVQYVLETKNASPLWIGTMSNPSGALGFYPAGWHAATSLVVQLAGVTIPVASNAVMIMFGAIAWPASIFLLTSTFVRLTPAALVGLFSATVGISAFPILLIDYGVLFPYMASLTLVPAAVALAVAATTSSKVPSTALAITFLGLLPGIAITHPGGLVALLAVVSAVLAVAFIRAMRSTSARRGLLVTMAIGYVAVVGAAWYVLRPDASARTWGPEMTVAQAIGEVAFASVNFASLNIVIAALVAVGVFVALKRREQSDLVLVLILAVVAVLYIVVAALPYWTPRDILVGAWYNNIPRLAALMPIAWVPLSAVGAQFIWDVVMTYRNAPEKSRPGLPVAALAAAATAIAVLVPQLTQIRASIPHAQEMYRYTEDSRLLTIDERDLILRLPSEVPEGVLVAGSSWTGAGLAYALTGTKVLMPHTLMELSDDVQLINEGLDDAATGSPVCEAVDRLDVEYVLDFGDQEINDSSNPMPGFDELSSSPAVTLVDEEGDAKLYRIVACP